LIVLFGILVLVDLGVAHAQTVATVSVNVSSLDKVIPADFDGFSIEVDDSANKYLGVASSPNLVFYQLLKNRSLVHVFHPVAQHAVDQPGELGSHGLGGYGRP